MIVKSKPIISVIMSVYNGAEFLAEAIESILNQTYTNFEFIIINDGSTDKSLEIIKSYMINDYRIIIINRKNRGLPYSLNEGIRKSQGKYIARMDADDISLPNRFESQIKFMEQNPDIGICGCSVIDIKTGKKWILSSKNKRLQAELLFSSVFAHPSVMIKKKVIIDHKLFYNENFLHSQDFELWTRMAEFTSMANLQKPLIKYRILETSITRQADKDLTKKYKILQSIFKKNLDRLGIINSEYENKLHFNLTVNERIRDNTIDLNVLQIYFNKILYANIEKNIFNSYELKKVLGKKWLRNFIYKKEFKATLSKYFYYGIWSVLSK